MPRGFPGFPWHAARWVKLPSAAALRQVTIDDTGGTSRGGPLRVASAHHPREHCPAPTPSRLRRFAMRIWPWLILVAWCAASIARGIGALRRSLGPTRCTPRRTERMTSSNIPSMAGALQRRPTSIPRLRTRSPHHRWSTSSWPSCGRWLEGVGSRRRSDPGGLRTDPAPGRPLAKAQRYLRSAPANR